jgi:peptide/nickel transport system substrate-binding protein
MKTRMFPIVGLLISLSMIMGACAPAATPMPTSAPTQAPPPTTAPAAASTTGATVAPTLAPTTAPTEPPASTGAPTASGPQGTLRVALTTQPNSLDVDNAAERNAINAAWQMYDSLVWVNDDGKMVPALAESWDISTDGTQYTFHLRKGVTFHNGEPFNAQSVVFSWERGKKPENSWSGKWAEAKSVEAVDDYTVKVTTDGPKPLLLKDIYQYWAIIPPQYYAKVGADGFAAHPVGTGPFQFVEWVKGDRIVMEANPNYWDKGLPKVQQIIFRPIPDSTTRVAAIQTNEIDIVTRLSSEEATSLKTQPGLTVLQYPVDRVFYVAFNNLTTGLKQPTMDKRVRQAMNYAVDRQAIVNSIFGGFARLSTGLVTPADLGYDPNFKPFAYDPAKARQLLADAGYPNGFSMDFACPAGAYSNFEEVCQAIQGYLQAVGIKTDLKIEESAYYWDLESKKQLPPLFGDGSSETVGETLPRANTLLGGNSAAYSAWSDPTIDDLLKKISTTIDDTQRAALYGQLQVYMQDNPPFIYLYELMTFEAVSNKVQGYKPRPGEDYFLKNVSLTP